MQRKDGRGIENGKVLYDEHLGLVFWSQWKICVLWLVKLWLGEYRVPTHFPFQNALIFP